MFKASEFELQHFNLDIIIPLSFHKTICQTSQHKDFEQLINY